MVQQWYYGQEGNKLGPCTAQELRDLALAGKILPSDIIWKEGIDQGMPASRVKNLFPNPPPTPAVAPPAANDSVPDSILVATPEQLVPEPSALVAEAKDASAAAARKPVGPYESKKAVRKAQATAVRGAKIFSQDGTDVQFKKICTTCGHEDSSRTTIKIRAGTIRIAFFCRKCRKSREVVLQGQL